MGDDIVGVILGVSILVAIAMLFIFAAVVAVPAVVILGGGYLGWRAYNNSEATQTRRDMEELRNLYSAIGHKIRLAGTPDADRLTADAIQRVETYLERPVPPPARAAVRQEAAALLGLLGGGLPPFDETALQANAQFRSEFRQQLYRLDEINQYGKDPTEACATYLAEALVGVLSRLPDGVEFSDTSPLSARLLDLMVDPKAAVQDVLAAAFNQENDPPALHPLQAKLDERLARIARKPLDKLAENPHLVPKPIEDPRPPLDVAKDFLAGSPFLSLLLARVSYELPAASRFEHMHILAGSGHGKTQLLQSFIKADIEALAAHLQDDTEGALRSVVVIDSQGDLLRNLTALRLFAPGQPLADRLVLVDPTDMLHPPALNMFDVGQDQFDKLPPNERAAIYNGTIELYVYLFSELLGASMTARQATMFRFLAQLLLAIPNANLLTFLAILEDDADCLAHVSKLDSTAQQFFTTQYVGDEFKGPKKEVAWRLWGVISNPALATMFNSPTSKIDLDAELQRGAVVLINTSKEVLKTEGSRLFGRFWVALVAQAALKRARVSVHNRTDTHVYLDEAHEIVDEKAEEILNQARKYKIGLTFSHQNLGQLRDNATRASVAASTAVKLIGGASDKDARAYAADLRTSPETILAAEKIDGVRTEFVTFVRNHMSHGVTLSVPFGQLEALPKSSGDERAAVRETNRAKYCYAPTAPTQPDPDLAPDEPTSADTAAPGGEPADPYEFKLGDPDEL